MALGRQRDRQSEMLVAWAEMPRSPGHVFYERLQAELFAAGFDRFVEDQCSPYYAARHGRPSLPPGRPFRMLLVGYFEGIGSERGLEWRCADSLSLREFLRPGAREPVPDVDPLCGSTLAEPHPRPPAARDPMGRWIAAGC
jgi:transposase